MKQQEFNAMSDPEKHKFLSAQTVKLESQMAIRSDAKVNDENACGRYYRVSFGEVIMSHWNSSAKAAMDSAYTNLEAFNTGE